MKMITRHFESRPARVERLLAERARRIAREKDPESDARAEVEWLTFWVSEQLFGVPLAHAEGVAPLARVISVPGAPPYIPGLVRVQGKFIVLIDLRELLLADRRGISDATKVVAVRGEDRVVGLAASDVHDVFTLAEAQFSSARPAADGLSRAVTIRGEPVALIDTQALVRDLRLTGLDRRGGPMAPAGS